ncbi:30S ribosomal protein S6 [Methylacidimicrobium sp. B4]|uniref:30S ribosomal protein S6 n=1 Tax=Methylacidimicrobium sp. B4 TaxID=2796139 RepID=UPI001A8ECAB5|nr:30S ribosomal protein S6 [Methylacidimicrobium sp. B4]QSR85124.1 30S ribosomal protein S6 [Methylacidimicrobium sp. B4]
MKAIYDGLYILNVQGKDENVKEAIEALESTLRSEEGELLGCQKMDRRRFERVAQRIESGYYVNLIFSLEPSRIDALAEAQKSHPFLLRQFYLRRKQAPETAASAA